MRPNEIVQRFLASIGRTGDAAAYLALFQAEQKAQFALIVVSDETLSQSLTALIADLLFLRKLELTPLLCFRSQDARNQFQRALPTNLEARACDANQVEPLCETGIVPLLVAETDSERAALLSGLSIRKVVYLIAQAGLQPQGEPLRSLVNLRTDYDKLSLPNSLPLSQQKLLSEVRTLFAHAAHEFTVALTSAHDILRELFTLKGAGTLVRRGTEIQQFSNYTEASSEQLIALLESAFAKTLSPQFYDRPVRELYIASDYRGAAILEERSLAPYLSKFAVNFRAQGEGIGGDIWRAMREHNPRLFWRSRPQNPIASFYTRQCDGLVRDGSWTVYWCGLTPKEIPDAVALAHAAPTDFEAE